MIHDSRAARAARTDGEISEGVTRFALQIVTVPVETISIAFDRVPPGLTTIEDDEARLTYFTELLRKVVDSRMKGRSRGRKWQRPPE